MTKMSSPDHKDMLVRQTNKDDESGPETSVVPYDENLLERSRTQWQFGDWESLVRLDRDILQHHPDRAKLALLAGAGRLQIGKKAEAKQFIRLAQDWCVSKKNVSQILIAGVLNSLGRAAAIGGEQNRALQHFENAISIGTPGSDLKLLKNARLQLQLQQVEKLRVNMLSLYKNRKSFILENEPQLASTGNYFENCESINCRFNSDTIQEISGRVIDRKICTLGRKEMHLFYRPDSKGDVGVLKQIFEDKQYEIGWLPQGQEVTRLMAKIRDSGGIPAIVDAGANIGASCAWFLERYAKSTILAIEPDLDNCELLRNNCAGRTVRLFAGGLADRSRILYFQDPDLSDWGFRVGEEGSRPVQCIGPEDILNECHNSGLTPVIFKIDIEGGEELVFSKNNSWFKEFKLIIIELHDWLLPEKNTSRNFMKAITNYEFQIITRGENLFCFNPHFKL